MAEPITIYKVTILYMLDKANIPLTNAQITGFFLDKDYTDYFSVQEGISSLEDSALISAETTRRATQYSLSSAGKETLGFFRAKITEGIENDVREYLASKLNVFRQENSIVAKYRRTKNCIYEVTCQLRSDSDELITLKIAAKNKEQAEAICRNWELKHEDVYAMLMDTLLT